MSSIFTFNHSPPKPASPWAGTPPQPTPAVTPIPLSGDPDIILDDIPSHLRATTNARGLRGSFVTSTQGSASQAMTDDGITIHELESEPQIGSTEYKLSLSRGGKNDARLEQLTTQLLWRLQQSTPYHATSLASRSPKAIASLLQESKGALYEIGVADDGTLVGLDETELDESIEVLRCMAAKLGASVGVKRRIYVRSIEEADVRRAESRLAEHLLAKQRARSKNQKIGRIKFEEPCKLDANELEKFHVPAIGTKLWVAEAFVVPGDGSGDGLESMSTLNGTVLLQEESRTAHAEELRISLTGPTTCGKSTLLGTLTTGELDNGRGKSRLGLLKHRHELVSGVTSSVAWEIFGYKPQSSETSEDDDDGFFGSGDSEPDDPRSRIVNYATGNISSWTDIHSACEGGRIVFMSDSAGHWKYRRTTVRSLVGWAPHYAALLIPANDAETENGKPGLSEDSRVHMELCIKLGHRLVVIFTKLDLASKLGLKEVFTKVLTTLKENGRKPLVLKSSKMVPDAVAAVGESNAVPIIFTSAVRGDNIGLIHELLMKLPVPKPAAVPTVEKEIENLTLIDNDNEEPAVPTTVFHIEEVYDLKPAANSDHEDTGSVVSGHVRNGKVSVGDTLIVGPFPVGEHPRSRSITPTPTATPVTVSSHLSASSNLLSCSPGSADESTTSRHSRRRSALELEEWRTVKVISIRHLRLPLTTLYAGQAGTIGVVPIKPTVPEDDSAEACISITGPTSAMSSPIAISSKKAVSFASPPRDSAFLLPLHLKKGLVFLNFEERAVGYTGFTAVFNDHEGLVRGSDVTVYIASVRVVARIVFAVEEEGRFEFEFVPRGCVEWIEHGAKVLVMKGGREGLCVGRVRERLREGV